MGFAHVPRLELEREEICPLKGLFKRSSHISMPVLSEAADVVLTGEWTSEKK